MQAACRQGCAADRSGGTCSQEPDGPGPAGVAESSINHFYRAAAKVLQNPDVRKRLAVEGAAAVGSPPAEFDAFVRAEISEWAKLIQTMNLQL